MSFIAHTALIVLVLVSTKNGATLPASEPAFVVDLMEELPAKVSNEPRGGPAPSLEAQPSERADKPAPTPLPVKVPKPSEPRKSVPKLKPAEKLSPSPDSKPPSEQSASRGPVVPNVEPSTSAGASSPKIGSDSGRAAGEIDRAAPTQYSILLLDLLNKHKEYPKVARRRGIEGTVVLKIILARDGSLQDFGVATSSGSDILDDSAKAMVSQAGPYPPFPESIPGTTATFLVPVAFNLS